MIEELDTNKPEEPIYLGCEHEECEPHICPFQEDINGDSETLCTCCDKCIQQCAADI